MNKQDKDLRAEKVLELIRDCEVMDAVDIFGKAINKSSKEGTAKNDIRQMSHAMIPMYYIATLVNECHGREAVVRINDDGSVSFTIKAGRKNMLKV